MMDLYPLAVVRMRELELREAELARPGRAGAAQDSGRSVSRPRIVLARGLIAAAERLWPDVGRQVTGAAR